MPIIGVPVQRQIHAYLAVLVRDLDSPYVVTGGVEDHVHILFDIGKLHTPVAFVEHVKKHSSKFIKTLGSDYREFQWQRGYGLFSVSPTHRDSVEQYVREQEFHHRKQSFQAEYRGFLQRYGIPFDERYVWD